MKMKPGEKAILPLWFRTGLVLTLLFTLYYSYTHRLSKNPAQVAELHTGVALAERSLNFIDLDAGAVSVVNADNGNELIRISKGEDGFMRSVMRGLVRDRKAQGIGPEIAFELVLWDDGLLSLIDPATSRRVELSAFGKDNVEAFTRLLPSNSPQRLSSL